MAARKRPAKGATAAKRKRPASPRAARKGPPPHIVTAWALAVVNAYIVAGRYVRLAAQRHLDDLDHGGERGLYFDPDQADRVFRFFVGFLRHTKGPLAGKPFKLMAWQKFVIGSVFGWMMVLDFDPKVHGTDPDRLRALVASGQARATHRFETVYEEVARGNGKSTKLAGLLLYMLGFAGEAAPECYSAATKRDQARIVFAEAVRMARRNAVLGSVFKIGRKIIEERRGGGEAQPLSSDASTQDGLNPFFLAVDELHAHKTGDLYDVLDSALGKRAWSLLWAITTAGDGALKESICLQRRKIAIDVLEGVLKADRIFACIFTLDEGDDWRNRKVWPKANPALAEMPALEAKIAEQCEVAKLHPARQVEFRRKRCNEWLSGTAKWFTPDVWANGVRGFDLTVEAERERFWATVEDRPCFAAIDLSSKVDITALALVWPPMDDDGEIDPLGDWYTYAWYFVPEVGIEKRVKRDRVPYDVWRDQGFITATKGSRVDYSAVRKKLLELRERFNIISVAADPWNATGLITDLQKHKFDIVEYRQGMRSYSDPTKEFDAIVYGDHLVHGGHLVTEWMALNVDLFIDTNDNMKPMKPGKTSIYRVDGVPCMVMATGLAIGDRDEGPEFIPLDEDFYARA